MPAGPAQVLAQFRKPHDEIHVLIRDEYRPLSRLKRFHDRFAEDGDSCQSTFVYHSGSGS